MSKYRIGEAFMQTDQQKSKHILCDFLAAWTTVSILIEAKMWTLSLVLCNLAEPVSISCGPDDVVFLVNHILQRSYGKEAGSVEVRKQSLEMCDLYSAAPNTFVLLRSCISSACLSLSLSLSFFPFPLMLCHCLQPLSWCNSVLLNQPLLTLLCWSPSPFWQLSVLCFLFFFSFCSSTSVQSH